MKNKSYLNDRVVKLNAELKKNQETKKYKKDEVLSVYAQYAVDTGLVKVINEIMQDQYYAPKLAHHAASSI